MKLKWTDYAVGQLDDLVDDVLERRGRAAARAVAGRLLSRAHSVLDLPRAAPKWGPAGDDSFRRLVVDEYVVLYRIAEAEGTVFILAVRHGRQRPLEPGEVPVR